MKDKETSAETRDEKELMRYILGCCAGRKQCDPEAEERLIDSLGSISRLLFASPAELTDTLTESGITRLRIVRAMFVLTELEKLGKTISAADENKIRRYISLLFMPHTAEAMYVIPITGKVLGDPYLLAKGNATSVNIDPERIISVLESSPSCKEYILCHNHPKDTCKPSDGDIEATNRLFGYLFTCGYTLKAHYISGTDGVGCVPFDNNPIRYLFGR